jgi:hypothetical protein
MHGPFFCVVPIIEPDRAKAIALLWEFITSQRQMIGYALKDDQDALFDENTGRLVMPNGLGLSCSTFVLVLFRTARYPIIDTTGWPLNRPGDKEAQEKLVQVLEKTCGDRAHIGAVKREMENGCERVRPEEVAGAALYDHPRVQYPEVEDAGLFIRGGLCLLGHIRAGLN